MTHDDRLAQPPPAVARVESDAWTEPFWAAAAAHRLVFACCRDCGRFRMPPTPFCPHCRSQAIDWTQPPGEAILYSYTIVEYAIIPDVETALPYVPAIVEYPAADHARLITNIVGSPLSALAVGRQVLLHWRDIVPGLSLPAFSIPANERPL